MVPYVRKSFYKHFIDGLRYIELANLYYKKEYNGGALNFLHTRMQYSDKMEIENELYK